MRRFRWTAFCAALLTTQAAGVVDAQQDAGTALAAPGTLTVEGPFVLRNSQGENFGVLYRFRVPDAGKVDENRRIVDQLFSAAVKIAEAHGFSTVALQAVETVGSLGATKAQRYYGYVWKKDATGNWAFYVKPQQ